MSKQQPSFYNGQDFSGLLSRKALFRWIAEFLEKCDISGSYWEFGVFQGESIKEAFYTLRDTVHAYVGFDSFQGLPPLKGIDREALKYTPVLAEGNYKSISQEFVEANIASTGLPNSRLILFPGFFDKTLVFEKYKDFLSDKRMLPSVVYVDVDLYESTKQVLDFIQPVLRTGCWILFDDYWCYRGASRYGTQKAIQEFLSENKNILLQEYTSFRGWSKAFIVERVDS